MKKIININYLSKRQIKKLTLDKIAHLWLESKNNLKIQSRQKYENLINQYIYDFFHDKNFCKIDKSDFENFFKDLNNKVSTSVQKTIIYIIKSLLNFAYQNKFCDYYIELDNIKFNNKIKFIYTLSIDEQKKLEIELKNNINIRKCCLLLCLYTGLRVGEVCGLKWENINFDAKTIQVRRTIQRIKNINDNSKNKTLLIESTPKSDTSNRIIPIPDFLINILQKFKKDDKSFILSNSNKLYDPRLFESFYKRILIRSNININKFHTLRHTFATRAIESKMDIKTLSEILGHSNVNITLKLYVHSSIELKRKSIENVVNYMTNA